MLNHLSSSPAKNEYCACAITRRIAVALFGKYFVVDWSLRSHVPSQWPVNYLLSVSTVIEHPNLVNPLKGELKRWWGANPF